MRIGSQNFASNFQVAYDVSTRKTFDVDASYLVSGLGGRHTSRVFPIQRHLEHTDQGYAASVS